MAVPSVSVCPALWAPVHTQHPRSCPHRNSAQTLSHVFTPTFREHQPGQAVASHFTDGETEARRGETGGKSRLTSSHCTEVECPSLCFSKTKARTGFSAPEATLGKRRSRASGSFNDRLIREVADPSDMSLAPLSQACTSTQPHSKALHSPCHCH